MLALSILLAAAAVISGQVARPYSRYYNPRYQPPRYDIAPEIVRDYRVNPLVDESPKPYSFSYNAPLEDGVGQSSRTETADGTGRVEGSYSLTNEEGHTRVVDYVADHDGFRASIQTNEPGTDNKSPANVLMNSAGPYAGAPLEYRRQVPIQPVLNALEEPVVAPVEEPIVPNPNVRPIYRRPNLYANRNYYPGYRRGYEGQRYPYNRPY